VPPLYGLVTGGCCPCGLVAGNRPLRPGRGRAAPCELATSGRPLWASPYSRPCSQVPAAPAGWPQPTAPCAGGLGHNRLPPCRWPDRGQPPLQGAWPWLAAHPPCCVCCENAARMRRSYIPVFQIRIEKMKEVKRPPLWRYPHDESLQRTPPI
ncbi:hypothetical protein BHM03_00030883, partial [Ensete ventricosum]